MAEAKTAVDVTADAGLPRSPAPAKRGSGSATPLSPPPHTPESRRSNAAVGSPSGGIVDRRQLFDGESVCEKHMRCIVDLHHVPWHRRWLSVCYARIVGLMLHGWFDVNLLPIVLYGNLLLPHL